MQMLAFNYPSMNIASVEKALKTWDFFFDFSISSNPMELTDISKPILWEKKTCKKLQPKGIFIQEGILVWNSGTARKGFLEPHGHPTFDGIRKLVLWWKAIAETDTVQAFSKIGHDFLFQSTEEICLRFKLTVNKTLIWWEADSLVYW